MKRYAFYWGCQIPARFPFMERSWRLVLEKMGLSIEDLSGFTCCPEKTLVKNMDEDMWKVMAARNLALASRAKVGLTMTCTGCYSTLKSVASRLDCYPLEREKINQKLNKVGLHYVERTRVRHLIELLHDEVGISRVTAPMAKKFKGMRIAVHGGCHLVRPSRAIHFDNPLKPVKYDNLVEALGAASVTTETKMLCCGGALDRVNQSEQAMQMARVKLKDLTENRVDAITVVCPECFKVYDNTQFLMGRQGEVYGIPVVTYSEMLGLAYGYSPEELGMNYHRIDVGPFLEKFEGVNS